MKSDSPIKKILLLGSTGLLGCVLSKDLEEHGYEVHSHGLNKKTVYKANLIKRLYHSPTLIYGSLLLVWEPIH
jgi:nucleoside-diphosphate-sugar epimerase